MTHRLLASVLLGASCCVVLLALGEVTPAAAGGQPKIKAKVNVPQGNQKAKKFRDWEPLPWEGFGGWHGGGFGGHTGGFGHVGGIGGFGGHFGGGHRAFGAVPSITGALDFVPGVNPFGGLGVPGFGDGLRERRSREEELFLGSLGGFTPGLDLMRDPLMRLLDPEDDVIQLLRLSRVPTLPTPASRVMNSFLMLDDDLAPFGSTVRTRGGLPGLPGGMTGMPGGLDAFAQLRMIEALNRPMNYTARGFGFGPGHSSQVMRLLQMIEGPGYGFGPSYLGGYGGYGYGGLGLGGLRNPGFLYDLGIPSYGPGMYLPGMPRRGIGGIGGFGPGFGGFGRPMVIAPPPPRPRGPTAEEQRAAMEKFHKSLVAVEAMARAGAWDALADGLSKTLQGSSLPEDVAAPLKGLQAEATRITDLLKLRDALARGWEAAPDAAALSRQLDSLRKGTGDSDLTDRLARLLAVKAAWEGHDAAAAALSPAGEVPDIDAELEALRKLRSVGAELISITTQDERELARRRVARGVLEEIDHHIDCGRFTAAVFAKDIQGMRVKAKELAGLAPKKSAADSRQATAEAVRKALGRNISDTEEVVLRKMHAAGKSVEAIVEALR